MSKQAEESPKKSSGEKKAAKKPSGKSKPKSSSQAAADGEKESSWSETVADMKESAKLAGKVAYEKAAKIGEDAKEKYGYTEEDLYKVTGTVESGLSEANSLRLLLKRVGYKLSGATLKAGIPPAMTLHLHICIAEITAAELLKTDEGASMSLRVRSILQCLKGVDGCKPTSAHSGFVMDYCDLRLSLIPSVEVHFALADDDDDNCDDGVANEDFGPTRKAQLAPPSSDLGSSPRPTSPAPRTSNRSWHLFKSSDGSKSTSSAKE